MTPEIPDDVRAGQAFYTPRSLSFYDLGVLGVSNAWIWRCPTPAILKLFNEHVSCSHLDVGVGTGFYLDRGRFPCASPRVALMDLNESALEFTRQRIKRYQPEVYVRNVLEPLSIDGAPFDSVSLNYLLHCVPGDLRAKAVVFDHAKALMNPGAVCFGSTLLHKGVKRGWTARKLMGFYNRKGIFSNHQDSLDDFTEEFSRRFQMITLKTVGCAVLFAGRRKD